MLLEDLLILRSNFELFLEGGKVFIDKAIPLFQLCNFRFEVGIHFMFRLLFIICLKFSLQLCNLFLIEMDEAHLVRFTLLLENF